MAIEQGAAVPPATLKQMTPDGIKDVDLASLLAGKKAILFGLSLDLAAFGLGERSQRYSMIVEDGVIKTINLEKGIFDHESSAASALPASVAA